MSGSVLQPLIQPSGLDANLASADASAIAGDETASNNNQAGTGAQDGTAAGQPTVSVYHFFHDPSDFLAADLTTV